MGRPNKAIEALAASVAERKQRERREREARGRLANLKRGTAPQGQPEALVNEFAARHGDYARDSRAGKSSIMRNRGGTAIDRWQANGLLSETQLASIAHMQRLWQIVDAGPRLVANLERTVFGCPGDGNFAEIEARDDINRISSGFPAPYWNVFENVVRFDEPAGAAGSRLSNFSRSAAEAARLIVCLIADTIYLRERLSY
ncbi:MAG: hypothetical protein LC656_04550 [Sphingomonadales bacterium]|nr:hypothetical protein [Sphingomonadales bacterium]